MTIRKVIISETVWDKINDLEHYLVIDLHTSWELAFRKTRAMRKFVHSLRMPVDYPICRFKQWCVRGYRCAIFEKTWIFAYEVFPEGIIVRDMSHTAILSDIS